MSAEDSCRVLSIQSHVVSGCVGNKAAVFPLQVLGFDVDFINSVQFSNHTGYPHKPRGSVLSGSDLEILSAGLTENHLLHYDYLLTGYIGSESFLFSILKVLDDIEKKNPAAKYVCDPVLGDNNQYYVPVGLVQTFKTQLIPRAYMITPNQFEAELLTDMKIHSEEDAVNALLQLHALGPEIVVLTSAELTTTINTNNAHYSDTTNSSVNNNTDNTTTATTTTEPSLHCYVLYPLYNHTSTNSADNVGDKVLMVTRIEISKIEGNYTGTGDATAALMLAWVHLLQQEHAARNSTPTNGDANNGTTVESAIVNNPISAALCNALATVKAMIVRSSHILQRHNESLHTIPTIPTTTANTNANNGDDGNNSSSSISSSGGGDVDEAQEERVKCLFTRAKELQVVKSKKDIEVPPVDTLNYLSMHTWRVK